MQVFFQQPDEGGKLSSSSSSSMMELLTSDLRVSEARSKNEFWKVADLQKTSFGKWLISKKRVLKSG